MLLYLGLLITLLAGCSEDKRKFEKSPVTKLRTTLPRRVKPTTSSFKTSAGFATTVASTPVPTASIPDPVAPITESVRLFTERRAALLSEFSALGSPYVRDSTCPALEITVDGIILKIVLPGISDTGGATVYREGTADKYVMKVSKDGQISFDQLWRDFAALEVLSESGAVPKKMMVGFDAGVSPACRLATIVMEKAGVKSLNAHRVSPLATKFVSEIGIAAINLLEKVHEGGLVHGDVHGGNFVFFESRPAESLRIIDFGRSRPYIDHNTGKHVAQTRLGEDNLWNPVLLSTGELEGWTVSRRDDMFRLAELLIYLVSNRNYIPIFATRADVLRAKQNPKFAPSVPKEYIQFYEETMALAFDATPDYDRFRALINQ